MVCASVVCDLPSLFWGWLLCLFKYWGVKNSTGLYCCKYMAVWAQKFQMKQQIGIWYQRPCILELQDWNNVIKVKINWWAFSLIFVLQIFIVCVFRWLIFSPSNHNSSWCHHMNNSVQYRSTTCSPKFVVVYRGWQHVNDVSTLKCHIIGNFCLQTSVGAKWGWCCVQGLTVFF